MRIYPHQMADQSQFKPFYSATPLGPSEDGSKVLVFDVGVPDDIFDAEQVEVFPVTENMPSGDQEK